MAGYVQEWYEFTTTIISRRKGGPFFIWVLYDCGMQVSLLTAAIAVGCTHALDITFAGSKGAR